MKIRTVGHLIRQGFTSILKNYLMAIASITTVTAALFIFGLFYTLLSNIDMQLETLKEKLQIVAYVGDNTEEQKLSEIEAQIKQIPDVKEVKYVSKEQGLSRYKADFAKDKEMQEVLEAVSKDNPIPATFEIKVGTPENIHGVNQQISRIQGITKVKDGKDIADLLIQSSRFIRILGIILLTILGLVSIFIISNTIKLTVYVRRSEINIMKYIGATDWFIRWPFIIEGLLIGLIGSFISLLVLGMLYHYGVQGLHQKTTFFVRDLQFISSFEIMNTLAPMMIPIGMVIGMVGSTISIKKYLKV